MAERAKTTAMVNLAETPETVAPRETAVPALFTWAGEMPAFTRLMEQFYAQVLDDPLLGPLFAHMDAEHARYVALFVAEVFGGPDPTAPNTAGTRTWSSGTWAKA